MHNNRLIRILSTFSAWELRSWGDFVASPYFNKHQKTQALAALLSSLHPDFSEETLQKEKLYTALFAGPFDEQGLRDVFSYLTRLTERFLAQGNWEQNDRAVQQNLLVALRERHLDTDHRRAYLRLGKQFSTPLSPSLSGQYYEYLAEGLAMEIQAKSRKQEERFHQTVQSLDVYYLLNRLRYGCAQINRHTVLADEGDWAWVIQLAAYVANQPALLQRAPLLEAYLLLFRMLEKPEETARFEKARSFIDHALGAADQDQQRELYAFLMNYCIQRVNQGDEAFPAVLFSLYQQQLAQGLLLENGQMSPADYKNLVSLALRNGETTWAEQFIDQYRDHLPEGKRANAFTFQLAALHFHRQQYTETLRLLRDQEFTDPYYQLGARTMLLKLYYETAEFEALYYCLDAFDNYLQRNQKLPSYQKNLYVNLLRYTRKLAKLRLKVLSQGPRNALQLVQQFRQKITHVPNTAQRAWLLTQVDEMAENLRSIPSR